MVELPSQHEISFSILDDGSKISLCDAHEAIHGCVRKEDFACRARISIRFAYGHGTLKIDIYDRGATHL
jgi:hypothetical protein